MPLSLSTALTAYHREEAFEVRLRVVVGETSLLLLRRPDVSAQWIEVRPGDEQEASMRPALQKLGLRRRRFHNGGRAWGLELDHGLSVAQLGQHLDRILNAVQGEDGRQAEVDVGCQRESPPQNPKLLEAMRAAANSQDGDTRKRLYAALVNATLLVPIDPTCVGRPEHEQQPLTLDGDQFVAFTDWDAVRQWQAHGHPFGLVHGVDFFGHAADQGASAVRINPDGVVGGALYASEVRMMADAVRGYIKQQGR